MAGADPLPGVIGPMSTSLEGIKLFMNVVVDSQPWLAEPALIPISSNVSYQISPEQPLKFGVVARWCRDTPHTCLTDHERTRFPSHPNVEGVDGTPYLHDEAWAIISSLYFTDGGAENAATIAESGEP